MLPKVNNANIQAETLFVPIGGGNQIFVKILRGPYKTGRTAIYIHGGGSGGNHTIIERPSRHLINDGFFDTIILPDRRGEGWSSPITQKHSVMEHARDMSALLDGLKIEGRLTSMGISYGGPIALDLASIDKRVERVVLVASSPILSEHNGLTSFLIKSGILKFGLNMAIKANLGKLPPTYTDFDAAFDGKSSNALMKLYAESLKRTPKDRAESLRLALESTLDESKASLDKNVTLSIPVIQVIGKQDEVWGSKLLPEYLERFPQFTQLVVPGGRIHKDAFFKAGLFYEKMAEALRASRKLEEEAAVR